MVFLKHLDWNLQCCTLVDVLDFYLSQGVVYSNDQLDVSFSALANGEPLKEKSNLQQQLWTVNNQNPLFDSNSGKIKPQNDENYF